MQQSELEELAQATRRRAGLNGDDFTDVLRIVETVLGPNGIVYDGSDQGPLTYLRRRSDGAFEIVLRPNLPDLRFRLLHEVGHVLLFEAGFNAPLAVEERAANYLAAAMIAPVDIVRRAHCYHGEKLRPLAKVFAISQTAMQLRLGEVLRDERSVVTKSGNVFVRTQGTFPWAETPVVEVARGRTRNDRLKKARLMGGIDAGRVALRAM